MAGGAPQLLVSIYTIPGQSCRDPHSFCALGFLPPVCPPSLSPSFSNLTLVTSKYPKRRKQTSCRIAPPKGDPVLPTCCSTPQGPPRVAEEDLGCPQEMLGEAQESLRMLMQAFPCGSGRMGRLGELWPQHPGTPRHQLCQTLRPGFLYRTLHNSTGHGLLLA